MQTIYNQSARDHIEAHRRYVANALAVAEAIKSLNKLEKEGKGTIPAWAPQLEHMKATILKWVGEAVKLKTDVNTTSTALTVEQVAHFDRVWTNVVDSAAVARDPVKFWKKGSTIWHDEASRSACAGF